MSAIVKSKEHQHDVEASTNGEVKKLVIQPKANGFGSSVNGGELLLLSLATCYCNDIYREAAKRNILVSEVEVEFYGDFGAAGEPGKNFRYKPIIKSNATSEQLEELIRDTDGIAEIHRTLREGLEIMLLK